MKMDPTRRIGDAIYAIRYGNDVFGSAPIQQLRHDALEKIAHKMNKACVECEYLKIKEYKRANYNTMSSENEIGVFCRRAKQTTGIVGMVCPDGFSGQINSHDKQLDGHYATTHYPSAMLSPYDPASPLGTVSYDPDDDTLSVQGGMGAIPIQKRTTAYDPAKIESSFLPGSFSTTSVSTPMNYEQRQDAVEAMKRMMDLNMQEEQKRLMVTPPKINRDLPVSSQGEDSW